jgi:hypothetical protein
LVLQILDMLTLFSPRLRTTSLHALAYQAPMQLVEHVRMFFKAQLALHCSIAQSSTAIEQQTVEQDSNDEHQDQTTDPHFLLTNLAEGVGMATLAQGLPSHIFAPLLYTCLANDKRPSLQSVARGFHTKFSELVSRQDIEQAMLEALKCEYVAHQQHSSLDGDGDETDEETTAAAAAAATASTSPLSTNKKQASRGRRHRPEQQQQQQSDQEDTADEIEDDDSHHDGKSFNQEARARRVHRYLSAFATRLASLFVQPTSHREEIGNIVLGAFVFAVDNNGGANLAFLQYMQSFIEKLIAPDANLMYVSCAVWQHCNSLLID